MQTRLAPITWSPDPLQNALDLELGPRMSPRPRVTTPQRGVRDSPIHQGTPWTPASSLDMSMQLEAFSPAFSRPGRPESSSNSPSSYRRGSAAGFRTSGSIRSSTNLPSVTESHKSRLSSTVRFADYRQYDSPSPEIRQRRERPLHQQVVASGVDRRGRAMQSSLRASTLPETHFRSHHPFTSTL
ncbi:hypothetical protein BD414DRAFT_269219 [Trametes punicea]|nr:hypothetical protein BD414DRAFT_269219 [Trametes punicea]